MSKKWLDEVVSEEFSEFFKGSLELARKISLEVRELLGEDYIVGVWTLPNGESVVLVQKDGTYLTYTPSDPETIATAARLSFESTVTIGHFG